MSQERALNEIRRFLGSSTPEVLSISGRWGVGKTYAWDETLGSLRAGIPIRRYAYVSVFGLRSLDALRTAIVQSTVSLDGNDLEPTVESFAEHVSSIAGMRKLTEELGRRSLGLFTRGAAAIPYVGKMADLLAPGAALLIRNQIVCIDDIERAGQGLDVADILGLVSSLRERRGCKVVLLLNEDGLGDQGTRFRQYLEKVVDQAIDFEPTPLESAAAALDPADPLAAALGSSTATLGVTNIRVIRRIRRFLSHVEPLLAGLHCGATAKVVHVIALLGWCVFEPKLAPDLERVRRYNRFTGMFGEDKRGVEEARVDMILGRYGFKEFDDVAALLLAGLKAGAFDDVALRSALEEIDRQLVKADVQAALHRPWAILNESLDDDLDAFVAALVGSIEAHGDAMTPSEASDALGFLRELGREDEAERLLPVYLAAQAGKPREFFAAGAGGFRRPLDPGIVAAFGQRLAGMPLVRDPAAVLIEIGTKNGWNPNDVAFLASVPVEDYRTMLKRLRGGDLSLAISTALRFGEMSPASETDRAVAERMTDALRSVSKENALNHFRLRPYLRDAEALAETGEAGADPGPDGR